MLSTCRIRRSKPSRIVCFDEGGELLQGAGHRCGEDGYSVAELFGYLKEKKVLTGVEVLLGSQECRLGRLR